MSDGQYKGFLVFTTLFLGWGVVVFMVVGAYFSDYTVGSRALYESRTILLTLFAFSSTLLLMTFTPFNEWLLDVLPLTSPPKIGP